MDSVFQLKDPHTHTHHTNHSPLRTSQPPNSLSAAGSVRASWPLWLSSVHSQWYLLHFLGIFLRGEDFCLVVSENRISPYNFISDNWKNSALTRSAPHIANSASTFLWIRFWTQKPQDLFIWWYDPRPCTSRWWGPLSQDGNRRSNPGGHFYIRTLESFDIYRRDCKLINTPSVQTPISSQLNFPLHHIPKILKATSTPWET